MIPLSSVSPSTLDREQRKLVGQKRNEIINAAKAMLSPTWGSEGTIVGMQVRVSREDLWIHPAYPIQHTADEITNMAMSLLRGQLQPLTLLKANDPLPREQGGTGGRYLVIDGVLRLRAAEFKQIPYLDAVFKEHASPFQVLLESVRGKSNVHTLQPLELARFLIALRWTYEREHAMLAEQNIEMEEFPTQEDFANLLGRSPTDISQWLSLVSQESAFVDLLYEGKLSIAQAIPLLSLQEKQRLNAALELVARRERGEVVTREDVRRFVRTRQYGPAQWIPQDAPAPSFSDLWIAELCDEQAPLAIAKLIHDLRLFLESSLAHLAHPDPILKELQRTLSAPKFTQELDRLEPPQR